MSSRKNGKFVKAEATEIREQASKTTSSSIQTAIAKAQQETIKTLSQVQEQAVTALNELETVKKAVEVERQELERIHGVAAIAKEIEEAQQNLADRKVELDRELAAYEIVIADKRSELERDLNAKLRANMESNTAQQDRWTFEFETKKRNEQSTWDEAKRRRDLDEQIRAEGFERSIKDREAQMAAKENEFVTLKAKVEAFPAELAAAIKKDVAIAENSLRRDHKHEIELLTSKFEAERTVFNNTLSSLRAESINKDKIIEQLTTRLAAADEKVSTIATKALETAGNVKALADVQTSTAIAANNGAKRA